jgi:thioesterase domain-containing protein
VGGIAALEVAQLLINDGEEVVLMALLDTEKPTAWRRLRTDLYFRQRRVKHILEVLTGILRAGRSEKMAMVRKVVHRKLKGPDQFYESKVGYRRMLYSHVPKHYPGRITLIVNEEQARIDKELGWTGAAQGGLEIHTVPGNHLNVMHDHPREVAQVISACIAKVHKPSAVENALEPATASVR